MRKNQLSPATSIVMALALAFGILVADLTNLHGVTAAGAQTAPSRGAAVANATVVGQRINAVNVLVNGVATNGVFRGSVAIADSLVYSGVAGGYEDNGIFPHVSEGTEVTGIFPHVGESLSAGGIFPHVGEGLSAGGIFPHVATTSSDPQLTGGVVQGDNVRVDRAGNITGRNLKVVGTVVSGGGAGSVLIGPGGTTTAPTF